MVATVMCCFSLLFILLFSCDLPEGDSQLWAHSVCLAIRFIGVVLQNSEHLGSAHVTEGHGSSHPDAGKQGRKQGTHM